MRFMLYTLIRVKPPKAVPRNIQSGRQTWGNPRTPSPERVLGPEQYAQGQSFRPKPIRAWLLSAPLTNNIVMLFHLSRRAQL